MRKPKKYGLKGKITVIIPVHYERHQYLERLLDYYSSVDVDILICDSSKIKFKNTNKYRNVKYHYYRNVPYAVKLNDIMKKIKTKYAVMCGVDDFITPDAMKKCIEFLEKNKDYASVEGQTVSFYKKNEKVVYGPSFMSAAGKDVNSEDIFERIRKQLNPYSEILYCVTRTHTLMNKYSDESCQKIKDYNVWEIFCTIISAIDGKHRILPIFYGARESMADSDANFVTPLNAFMKSRNNKDESANFLNLLTSYVSAKVNIPTETAKKKMIAIIKEYADSERKHNARARMRVLKLAYSLSPRLGLLIKNTYFEIKRMINIRKTKNLQGYPFYDEKAKEQLAEIDRYVKKHNIPSKWRTIQV
jgi:glycosyltransferase domain-containing protein